MNQDVRKILAGNIKTLRDKQGITKENLSIALDFDNSYISKVEKQKVNITLDRLVKIADFFNVKVENLLH